MNDGGGGMSGCGWVVYIAGCLVPVVIAYVLNRW
jgi:hypothetical protein